MTTTPEFPLVIVGGPWPERIGRRCRDVTADLDESVYPRHGIGPDEAAVLIDEDPLIGAVRSGPFGCDDADVATRGWSCVIRRESLAGATP